jgi:hypothetical protein
MTKQDKTPMEAETQGVTAVAAPEQFPTADPMVSMIERLILNPDADLDKLERMLAMKERIEAQQAKTSFARDLSAARATVPPIIKDACVDFTHNGKRTFYQHETLAGIAKIIDPILSRHGLSYRFRTDQGNGGVRVTCVIQHSDGHSEETSLVVAPDQSGNKNGFQAVGSAVTYLQRYTLKAALGLSAEVDDDAQSASSPTTEDKPTRQAEPRKTTQEKVEAAQTADDINALLSEVSALNNAKATRHLHDKAMSLGLVGNKQTRRYEVVTPALDGDVIPYEGPSA